MRGAFAALATAALMTATATIATTPPTQDWWLIDLAKDGSEATAIDKISLKHVGGMRRARILVVDRDDGPVATFDTIVEADCGQRRLRLISVVRLNAAGALIGTLPSVDWSPVPAADVGEPVFDYVCSDGTNNRELASLGYVLPVAAIRKLLVDTTARVRELRGSAK